MAYGLRWATSVSTKRVGAQRGASETGRNHCNIYPRFFADAPLFGLGIACCCKVAMTEMSFAPWQVGLSNRALV